MFIMGRNTKIHRVAEETLPAEQIVNQEWFLQLHKEATLALRKLMKNLPLEEKNTYDQKLDKDFVQIIKQDIPAGKVIKRGEEIVEFCAKIKRTMQRAKNAVPKGTKMLQREITKQYTIVLEQVKNALGNSLASEESSPDAENREAIAKVNAAHDFEADMAIPKSLHTLLQKEIGVEKGEEREYIIQKFDVLVKKYFYEFLAELVQKNPTLSERVSFNNIQIFYALHKTCKAWIKDRLKDCDSSSLQSLQQSMQKVSSHNFDRAIEKLPSIEGVSDIFREKFIQSLVGIVDVSDEETFILQLLEESETDDHASIGPQTITNFFLGNTDRLIGTPPTKKEREFVWAELATSQQYSQPTIETPQSTFISALNTKLNNTFYGANQVRDNSFTYDLVRSIQEENVQNTPIIAMPTRTAVPVMPSNISTPEETAHSVIDSPIPVPSDIPVTHPASVRPESQRIYPADPASDIRALLSQKYTEAGEQNYYDILSFLEQKEQKNVQIAGGATLMILTKYHRYLYAGTISKEKLIQFAALHLAAQKRCFARSPKEFDALRGVRNEGAVKMHEALLAYAEQLPSDPNFHTNDSYFSVDSQADGIWQDDIVYQWTRSISNTFDVTIEKAMKKIQQSCIKQLIPLQSAATKKVAEDHVRTLESHIIKYVYSFFDEKQEYPFCIIDKKELDKVFEEMYAHLQMCKEQIPIQFVVGMSITNDYYDPIFEDLKIVLMRSRALLEQKLTNQTKPAQMQQKTSVVSSSALANGVASPTAKHVQVVDVIETAFGPQEILQDPEYLSGCSSMTIDSSQHNAESATAVERQEIFGAVDRTDERGTFTASVKNEEDFLATAVQAEMTAMSFLTRMFAEISISVFDKYSLEKTKKQLMDSIIEPKYQNVWVNASRAQQIIKELMLAPYKTGKMTKPRLQKLIALKDAADVRFIGYLQGIKPEEKKNEIVGFMKTINKESIDIMLQFAEQLPFVPHENEEKNTEQVWIDEIIFTCMDEIMQSCINEKNEKKQDVQYNMAAFFIDMIQSIICEQDPPVPLSFATPTELVQCAQTIIQDFNSDVEEPTVGLTDQDKIVLDKFCKIFYDKILIFKKSLPTSTPHRTVTGSVNSTTVQVQGDAKIGTGSEVAHAPTIPAVAPLQETTSSIASDLVAQMQQVLLQTENERKKWTEANEALQKEKIIFAQEQAKLVAEKSQIAKQQERLTVQQEAVQAEREQLQKMQMQLEQDRIEIAVLTVDLEAAGDIMKADQARLLVDQKHLAADQKAVEVLLETVLKRESEMREMKALLVKAEEERAMFVEQKDVHDQELDEEVLPQDSTSDGAISLPVTPETDELQRSDTDVQMIDKDAQASLKEAREQCVSLRSSLLRSMQNIDNTLAYAIDLVVAWRSTLSAKSSLEEYQHAFKECYPDKDIALYISKAKDYMNEVDNRKNLLKNLQAIVDSGDMDEEDDEMKRSQIFCSQVTDFSVHIGELPTNEEEFVSGLQMIIEILDKTSASFS